MSKLYWLLPILLFVAQIIFTLNSSSQIRYEELAEGVRNPFWLSQRLIYDGTSSNVGWYGSLLIVYKIFGFSLFYAKYFRLVLHLFSLISLAYILKRFLGRKMAILPLVVIGLSPSWLFLNTLQTSYGTDLQYFPIILALFISPIKFLTPLGWALAMIAWMSYPTFTIYLPVLLFLSWRKRLPAIVNIISFLTPLVLAVTYVKNRQILLFDPRTGTGIFRGAGGILIDAQNFASNLSGFVKDLFISGQSYHFELNKVEFSDWYPLISVIFVLILGFKMLKSKQKSWVMLAWIMLLAAILLPGLTLDPSGQPGMRRFSAVLAAFYGMMVVVMYKLKISNFKFQIGMGCMFLLLLHHIIVYPINLIHQKDPSLYREPVWFRDTPAESLQTLVNTVQKQDLKLICDNCRLVEVYAAVAGQCVWNRLDCHQILGPMPLSTKLWDDYFFEH